MGPLLLVIIIVSGVLSATKLRNKHFTKAFKQKVFLTIALIMLFQQVVAQIYFGFVIKHYWEMQYSDLCMMTILLTIIGGIFYRKTTVIIKMVTPWALVGMTFALGAQEFSFHETFYTMWINIFSHVMLGIFFFTSIILNRDFCKKDIRNSFFYILAFFAYVLVVCSILGNFVNPLFFKYTTALFRYDYTHPNSDYGLFGQVKMPYPIPTILFYIICCSFSYTCSLAILKYNKTAPVLGAYQTSCVS